MFKSVEKLAVKSENLVKSENEELQSKLKVKTFELEQLKQQYEHKNNELTDIVSQAFLGFRRITELASRNDYGQPQQKIRQINEFAETQKNYFAQLTLGTKNRTITTNQSNK